jgi:hypothetical protein
MPCTGNSLCTWSDVEGSIHLCIHCHRMLAVMTVHSVHKEMVSSGGSVNSSVVHIRT